MWSSRCVGFQGLMVISSSSWLHHVSPRSFAVLEQPAGGACFHRCSVRILHLRSPKVAAYRLLGRTYCRAGAHGYHAVVGQVLRYKETQ